MKSLLSTTILFLICISAYSQTVGGKVISEDGLSISGVSVIVKETGVSTITDVSGNFSIVAKPGSTLVFSHVGFSNNEVSIPLNFNYSSSIIQVKLSTSSQLQEMVVVVSSQSSWLGASIGYNFSGKADADNVIGAGKVVLNMVPKFKKNFRLNVIGNLTKFTSAASLDDHKKDIQKLAQSSQGLTVGLEPLLILKADTKNDIFIRSWATINYKINSFQNVKDSNGNVTNESVAINQGRFTLGSEIEFFKFESGRMMHFGVEAFANTFDREAYNRVFGENRNNIIGFEWSFILPIFDKYGFAIGQTFSTSMKPVLSAGIVIGVAAK